MDDENTRVSVNYPTPLLQWPVTKDPALNQALTRAYNNWVADISDQAPERLKLVTVIDAQEAAREMARTKKFGLVDVMVFGDYGAKSLDHNDFAPIWRAASDLNMPVNVHPETGALDAVAAFPSVGADQCLTSDVRRFKTICSSGLLDRHPDVRVSFPETSCA